MSQCYLKEGDVVLTKKNNSSPQLSWKKGVIEKLIIGNDKNIRGTSVRTTYKKLTKTIALNVETIEKDKSEPLKSIIEKHCDITPNENIENRRSRRLARNANIMSKLMFEQRDIEI